MIYRTSTKTVTASSIIKEDSSKIQVETNTINYNEELQRNQVTLRYKPRGAIISCIVHGTSAEGDIAVDGEFDIAQKTVSFLYGNSHHSQTCEIKYLIED
jgi:hypothetical protein